MFTLERQNEILEYLKLHKSAKITDLANKFFIGDATIRRDLEKLEKQNLIKRTYGGAVLLEGLNLEIPLMVREREQIEAKHKIAQKAVKYVNDGDIIILDSSSTTYAMIKELTSIENLTIITNGLKTATALAQTKHHNVYCTGGKLRENSLSLVGDQAKNFIRNYHASKLFFSCRALSSTKGAMDSSDEEAELRKVMIECSDCSFLLCDTEKHNKNAFYKICDYNQIDTIIDERN